MTYTDRKLYRWVVIGVCSLFLVYKYILQVYPSVLTNALMQAFHLHGAGLGNLAATYFYTYLIVQLFVGILLDKFSIRILGTMALMICAIGAVLFSGADQLWVVLIARGLMGVGVAFATVTYMKAAAIWFERQHFAFVSGLLATAVMVGAVFGEAPLASLVDAIGWRQSILVMALVGFVIAGLFGLIVQDQPKASWRIKTKNWKKISFQSIGSIYASPQNWIITLYSGLAFAPVAVFAGLWGNPFIQCAYGFNALLAGQYLSFVFVGLALGGPFFGFLSDYHGRRKPAMLFGVILSLIMLLLAIYTSHLLLWQLAAILFFFGFGTGAFMLGFAVGKELNPLYLAATIIALINSGDALFGAITEPLVGKFLDLGPQTQVTGVPVYTLQNYHHALIILPIYLVIAASLIFLIREPDSQAM